ncbi:MAG: adenylate/guanylate cyclase domain-containing protein [Pseudomonadota bacterium]
MKKFSRIILPLIVNIITAMALLYLTNELKTKVLSAFAISIAVMALTLSVRRFMDIVFYFVIYGLIATGVMSFFVYSEISMGVSTSPTTTVITFASMMLVTILSELYIRMLVKRMADGCLNGELLDKYVRSPWLFLDEKKKKTMSVLHFDIPYFGKMASEVKTNTVVKVMNYLFAKSMQTAKKYSASVIKRSEDSITIVIEPLNPNDNCAYNAVLCGMELKQAVEDVKERVDSLPVKRLQGRVIIATADGILIKSVRMGKLEFSIFTDALCEIDEIAKLSNGEDILMDSKTYELCSDYFSIKFLSKKAYSVMGLSGY